MDPGERKKRWSCFFFFFIEIIYIIQLLKIGSKWGVVQQEEPEKNDSQKNLSVNSSINILFFRSVKNLKKI